MITSMDSKERAKYLKEQLSSARKTAIKVDTALTAAEERKEFAKMVEDERARQNTKKRTFANPKTADEATGEIPTLEQLANGEPLLRSENKWKTKEEILEDGTLIEKLRLYFSSGDLDGYFGTKGKLTKQEIAKIVASIKTPKDRQLVQLCSKEYNTLIEYGKQLHFYFKRFQTSFAMLATLLNKWDSYEQTAKQLTILYGIMKRTHFPITPQGEKNEEREMWAKLYLQNFLDLWINENIRLHIFDGAALNFNKANQWFYVDVDCGIYRQIKEEAKETTEALADFKAFAVVIEEFIENSTLRFMPIAIQMSIENAEEERYTRYLVKNLSFFRSRLSERRENKETVTPEDEKKAVIPDYYEVAPSKDVYKSCKIYVKQLMNMK